MSALFPSTPEILSACHMIEDANRRFLRARDSVPKWGEHESLYESYLMMFYSMRLFEGILTLARADLVNLPGALSIMRSVFETGVKVMWILLPDDLFECDTRWLRFARRDINPLKDTASLVKPHDAGYAAKILQEAGALKGYHTVNKNKIEKQFPGRYDFKPDTKLPDMPTMLKDLNSSPHYYSYRRGSQYTHGGPIANGLYRKNYGQRQFSEAPHLKEWALCMQSSWTAFAQASHTLFSRAGANAELFCTVEQYHAVHDAIDLIRDSDGRSPSSR